MGVKVRERNGAWWLFIDHQGRRKARRVGTGPHGKKAAHAAALQIQAKLALGDAGLFEGERRAGLTFKELAEEWLAKYPLVNSISQTTLENYTSFTRRHLIPYFTTLPVGAITPEKIEDFIAAKRNPGGSARFQAKPLSESSLRTGLITLRLILQRAVKANVLPANPALGVGRFSRNDEETVDPFTVAELRAILGAAQQEPEAATLFRLWAQTGMRAGEVRSLRWGDADAKRGVLMVQRTYSRGRIGPTKTRRTRAVSALHPVAEETPEWRPGATVESRAVLIALRRLPVQSLDPEAYVFGKSNGKPWDSATVLRAWKRALKAAQVRYRPPEQLRHTFASTMLSRNAPLLYVQRQGGWRSASVLLRVYARWMPQEYDDQSQPSATPAQPANTLEVQELRKTAG